LKDESVRQRYPSCYSESPLFVPNFSKQLTPHLIPEVTTHRRSGAAISHMAKDVIICEMGPKRKKGTTLRETRYRTSAQMLPLPI
jgi:hypothetical protein